MFKRLSQEVDKKGDKELESVATRLFNTTKT